MLEARIHDIRKKVNMDANKHDQDIRLEDGENIVVDVIVIVIVVRSKSKSTTIEHGISDSIVHWIRSYDREAWRRGYITRCRFDNWRDRSRIGNREHRQTEFREENRASRRPDLFAS